MDRRSVERGEGVSEGLGSGQWRDLVWFSLGLM